MVDSFFCHAGVARDKVGDVQDWGRKFDEWKLIFDSKQGDEKVGDKPLWNVQKFLHDKENFWLPQHVKFIQL